MPPNVPLDLLDQIRKLEDRLRVVEGRAQIRPAMNQVLNGDVVVGEGGSLRVLDTDGSVLFWVGKITPNHVDGSEQRGVIINREDGTQALAVYTGGPEPQGIVIRDRAANALFAEDVVAGGLARPYLESSGWFGAVEQPTFVTSSASFVTVTMTPWYKQNPKVTAFYLVRCSDGTTAGEIQLTDDVGNAITPVIPIAAGSFTYGSVTGSITGAHESQTYLRWKARVTAGAGSIGVKGLATYGVQS